MLKIDNQSYWEKNIFFKKFDLIVIGGGIVGLSTAISFKQKNKKASILVIERGILNIGASSKNAGFACFGSVSELLDDLTKIPGETVWQTVKMRWLGLQLLRKRIGDKNLVYQNFGGYELFDDEKMFDVCCDSINDLNKKIKKHIGQHECYSIEKSKRFNFGGINGIINNKYEGQIDTGCMMENLIKMAHHLDIKIVNNINILKINNINNYVELLSDYGVFKATKVVVATNGFAKQLLNMPDVNPARAQVLITKPIKNLKIKGSFHYQKGFYYFRNINDRILFGGGRNLDIKGETTTEMGINTKIQNQLDYLLKNMILPNKNVEVDYRWSGIMGIGSEKMPIIKSVYPNVLAAVRMGGMGIAIGSMVGEIAAKEIS